MVLRKIMSLGEFLNEAKNAETEFNNTHFARKGKPLYPQALMRMKATSDEQNFFRDLQCYGPSRVTEAGPSFIGIADRQGHLEVLYTKAEGGTVGIKATSLVTEEAVSNIMRVASKYNMPVVMLK